MIERARDLQWDRVGSNPQLCLATGHTNFCSFLSLNFLFWQTEITPNWQNLSGFKKDHIWNALALCMTYNRHKVTKDQCWKAAHAGDAAKPFLAGLLPRGLATNTDDTQRELGLARRDPCHWAQPPQGLCPTGKYGNQGLLCGQGHQGRPQSPNSASLGTANQTSIHH